MTENSLPEHFKVYKRVNGKLVGVVVYANNKSDALAKVHNSEFAIKVAWSGVGQKWVSIPE